MTSNTAWGRESVYWYVTHLKIINSNWTTLIFVIIFEISDNEVDEFRYLWAITNDQILVNYASVPNLPKAS